MLFTSVTECQNCYKGGVCHKFGSWWCHYASSHLANISLVTKINQATTRNSVDFSEMLCYVTVRKLRRNSRDSHHLYAMFEYKWHPHFSLVNMIWCARVKKGSMCWPFTRKSHNNEVDPNCCSVSNLQPDSLSTKYLWHNDAAIYDHWV